MSQSFKLLKDVRSFKMGAAVLLPGLLLGLTAYAQEQAHAQPRRTALREVVYVPKSPRRPIIMVWPSVMNPAVADKVLEKIELREINMIKCNYQARSVIEPISLLEVEENLYEIHPFEELSRAPYFFYDLVPKLIEWLSAEVIECGFNTIFARKRQAIYRFINDNRSEWLKALRELTYILLQVIAVIHHKTGLPTNETLNWLEDWPESYEYWHRMNRDAYEYLQMIILSSLDIVTAWLFDYIATYSNTHKWGLSDDPDTTCALRSYDMYNTSSWEYLIDTVEDTVEDKMKAMADMFITCNVTSGCKNYDPIFIAIGNYIGVQKKVVRIPDPTDCEHTCTLLPNAPRLHKYYALVHAHMTSEVGHDLYCTIRGTKITHYFSHNIVRKKCRPQIVQMYLNARTNKICCKDPSLACCKSLRPRCEIVTVTNGTVTDLNGTVTDLNGTLYRVTDSVSLQVDTKKEEFYEFYESDALEALEGHDDI